MPSASDGLDAGVDGDAGGKRKPPRRSQEQQQENEDFYKPYHKLNYKRVFPESVRMAEYTVFIESRKGVKLGNTNPLMLAGIFKNEIIGVYGYKLVQLKGKGIQYIMVLSEKLPSTCEPLPSTYSEPNHRKLLIAALTHIFMSGGAVKDTDMWNFLAKSKLLEENDMEGRKILTQIFPKQLYLEYNKVGTNEHPRFEFSWGQQADEELVILHPLAEGIYFKQNGPSFR